jgi:hypothetical protein
MKHVSTYKELSLVEPLFTNILEQSLKLVNYYRTFEFVCVLHIVHKSLCVFVSLYCFFLKRRYPISKLVHSPLNGTQVETELYLFIKEIMAKISRQKKYSENLVGMSATCCTPYKVVECTSSLVSVAACNKLFSLYLCRFQPPSVLSAFTITGIYIYPDLGQRGSSCLPIFIHR